MKLVYKATGVEVKVGDIVPNSRPREGELSHYKVESIEKPRHGGSTGKVYVRPSNADGTEVGSWSHGYYPTVVDAEWIDRDDQG